MIFFSSSLWLQVYLFISSQKVVGCLVAEPIGKSFEIVLISGYERFDDVSSKEGSASSNKLELGTISFQREVIKEPLMLIVVMFWMGHPTKLDI